MKKLTAICIALTLTACATPYGKYGLLGGFTDSRIDENTFSISVDTNGFTNQQTTSMHAMYRAAELTVENGYDYFVIANDSKNPTGMTMNMPGSSYTSINSFGNTATARTTYTPGASIPMVFPNSTLAIKSFKGNKPTDAPNAYDARSVMTYLGPQIGVDRSQKVK